MTKVTAGPMQYADAAPSESRLQTFRRLAKLRFDESAMFKEWAEKNAITSREDCAKAWKAAWETTHVVNLFDCVREAAVMDESFRLPQLNAGTEEFQENVQVKFEKLMKRISILALTIQRELESHSFSEADLAELPTSSNNEQCQQ